VKIHPQNRKKKHGLCNIVNMLLVSSKYLPDMQDALEVIRRLCFVYKCKIAKEKIGGYVEVGPTCLVTCTYKG
jgi:hypothetical protein